MAADLFPSTMRLALLSPINGQSIDHIARQLENYRVFLAPFELRHYFHVSLESHPELQSDLTAFAEREGHSIVFTKRSQPTWRPCTAYALCELVKTALADHQIHDKVLIHTDTDLLVSAKAKDQLQNHRIGCGNKQCRLANSRWRWGAKAKADPRLKCFIKEILDGDLSKLRSGRVCGAYMPWAVFKIFGVIYNHYFKNNYLKKNPQCVWPVTEIAIPSILHLLEGQGNSFQPPLIKVPKEKEVSCKMIDQLLENNDNFGLKKIMRNSDSEAFQYVMRLQAQAAGERL